MNVVRKNIANYQTTERQYLRTMGWSDGLLEMIERERKSGGGEADGGRL